jgi:hypothetical protein
MYEYILACVAFDKSKAFIVVEPFDSADFGHFEPPAWFAVPSPHEPGWR